MKLLFTLCAIVLIAMSATAQWKAGDPFTDTRDGQVYKTVIIGKQVWMAENMNYGTMIPTTKAGYEMKDNQISEKYCWSNDTENCDGKNGKMKRGGFYEWQEAMQYWSGQPTLPIQGICPNGWHMPSNAEWNELFNSTGGANCYQNLGAGGSSGFEALMTGYRCTMTGNFRTAAMTSDTRTYFWGSEQTDAENAPIIELGPASIQAFSFSKSVGLCIRCILDAVPSGSIDDKGSNDFGFSAYPNPASGNLKISLNNYGGNSTINLELSDLLGNVVMRKFAEMRGQGIDFADMDLSAVPDGTYIITAKNGFTTRSNRISVLK